MKKIIIVNNNMKVGGVQKSLYNLLWSIDGRYDVTLLLFRAVGEYADRLPPNVKILECGSLFRYFGASQDECRMHLRDRLERGVLAAACKLFGRSAVMPVILGSQKQLPEQYDCALSFLHDGKEKSFYGGTQDFVLRRIPAQKKIAFLHCDYERSGANHIRNNRLLAQFDTIAACSEGCRASFARCVPGLADRCVTVRNCHRLEEIRALAEEEPVCYEPGSVHVVMVSRLAREKGMERGIHAVTNCIRHNLLVTLHIVGSGPMEQKLRTLAEELEVAERVRFYGEQNNPYRYIRNADLFLMTSYHEAAPMVIEEAKLLGVPVLTVETTSSEEMVTQANCGWVCKNSQEALNASLLDVLSSKTLLQEKRALLQGCRMSNDAAIKQFVEMIEGYYEN